MSETPRALQVRLTPQLSISHVGKDRCEVTWRIDRQREDIIRGYNVYVAKDVPLSNLASKSPRLRESLYNASTYPGDTDGDIRTESIAIEGLETGARHYVHVRTVFPDGHFSPPSDEFEVIPRPHGRFVLHPRFGGNPDGYSFTQDDVVPGNSETNDVYLYATDNGVFLASPSRLDKGLRRTLYVDLGPSDSLEDYPQLEEPWVGEEKIGVRPGRSIGLILTGKRIAKLRPIEIHRSDDNPRVVFEYVYQPVRGETSF